MLNILMNPNLEHNLLEGEAVVAQTRQPSRIGCILLAVLPLISFLGQLAFSIKAGTEHIMYHHLTVMVVDWVFVPFNYFVVRVIDWRNGGRLYSIVCISVILNILTHAFWQYNAGDPGHMINNAGVVLPGGWVHLAFSILEMVLLVAFVFCRKPNASGLGIVTLLAATYFLVMGVCGYVIHSGFMISDVIVSGSGLFFVLVYPRLIIKK